MLSRFYVGFNFPGENGAMEKGNFFDNVGHQVGISRHWVLGTLGWGEGENQNKWRCLSLMEQGKEAPPLLSLTYKLSPLLT